MTVALINVNSGPNAKLLDPDAFVPSSLLDKPGVAKPRKTGAEAPPAPEPQGNAFMGFASMLLGVPVTKEEAGRV